MKNYIYSNIFGICIIAFVLTIFEIIGFFTFVSRTVKDNLSNVINFIMKRYLKENIRNDKQYKNDKIENNIIYFRRDIENIYTEIKNIANINSQNEYGIYELLIKFNEYDKAINYFNNKNPNFIIKIPKLKHKIFLNTDYYFTDLNISKSDRNNQYNIYMRNIYIYRTKYVNMYFEIYFLKEYEEEVIYNTNYYIRHYDVSFTKKQLDNKYFIMVPNFCLYIIRVFIMPIIFWNTFFFNKYKDLHIKLEEKYMNFFNDLKNPYSEDHSIDFSRFLYYKNLEKSINAINTHLNISYDRIGENNFINLVNELKYLNDKIINQIKYVDSIFNSANEKIYNSIQYQIKKNKYKLEIEDVKEQHFLVKTPTVIYDKIYNLFNILKSNENYYINQINKKYIFINASLILLITGSFVFIVYHILKVYQLTNNFESFFMSFDSNVIYSIVLTLILIILFQVYFFFMVVNSYEGTDYNEILNYVIENVLN